jgi:hypothetical protein
MTYITIDLDWPTKLEIRQAWHRAERLGYAPEGRVSSSGHGVHIRSSNPPSAPIGINESERRYCKDDPARIAGDTENRLPNNQVLWDEKDGKKSGPWADSLHKLIARYERSVTLTPTQHKAKHD